MPVHVCRFSDNATGAAVAKMAAHNVKSKSINIIPDDDMDKLKSNSTALPVPSLYSISLVYATPRKALTTADPAVQSHPITTRMHLRVLSFSIYVRRTTADNPPPCTPTSATGSCRNASERVQMSRKPAFFDKNVGNPAYICLL
jgi:hypothetical protein